METFKKQSRLKIYNISTSRTWKLKYDLWAYLWPNHDPSQKCKCMDNFIFSIEANKHHKLSRFLHVIAIVDKMKFSTEVEKKLE